MAALGELYLLAAYLAIGLMSITVPTYAIAVTYLARETSESRKDLQKRRKELAQKLEELRKRLEDDAGVISISEEIKKYEKEDERLKERQLYLSAKGAVGYPFASFLLTLCVAAYGYYSGTDGAIWSFLLIFMGIGLFHLGKSLLAIEQAALRPEEVLLPALSVAFDSGADTTSCKAAEQKDITFLVRNQGKDLAETICAMFFFSPEFQVIRGGQRRAKQLPVHTHPNYEAVIFDYDVIHPVVDVMSPVTLKMPDKPATYDVPVTVSARKIGRLEFRLRFEVSE